MNLTEKVKTEMKNRGFLKTDISLEGTATQILRRIELGVNFSYNIVMNPMNNEKVINYLNENISKNRLKSINADKVKERGNFIGIWEEFNSFNDLKENDILVYKEFSEFLFPYWLDRKNPKNVEQYKQLSSMVNLIDSSERPYTRSENEKLWKENKISIVFLTSLEEYITYRELSSDIFGTGFRTNPSIDFITSLD